jgi:CsoR family transcriptional regulator, copper-sensing transcriptional repressor
MLDEASKSDVHKRLRRIEGQVQGLQRMVEENRYCVDVMLQLSAAQGALTRVSSQVLAAHLHTCVQSALESGDRKRQNKVIDELQTLFERHRRS